MKHLNALWVGGPPGKTLQNIRKNLQKDGVEMVEAWDATPDTMRNKHRIPTWADVVLLNHEMCSHGLQSRLKDLCRKANKPLVLASLSTKRTVEELRLRNLIPSDSIKSTCNPVMPKPSVSEMVEQMITEKRFLMVQKSGIEARISELEAQLAILGYEQGEN